MAAGPETSNVFGDFRTGRNRATMSLIEPGHVTQFRQASIDVDPMPVRESYPAVTTAIPEARAAITDFALAAGAGPEQLEEIRLAVSEALTNVVRYAYPWRTGHIYVTARVAGDELWILIADNGCGIHAGRESDGLGLGLALISHLTDGFSVVERSLGGTELRLRFAMSARRSARPPRGRGRGHGGQLRGSVASATFPAASRFSTTT